MRVLKKNTPPEDLIAWCKSQSIKAPQNLHYRNVPADVRKTMLMALAQEQMGLCAYTMRRFRLMDKNSALPSDSHIEHVLPQSNHPGRTLDWGNLLACYPQPGLGCEFGAVKKGAYDPATLPFVSPLSSGAEQHFRYRRQGDIQGLSADGEATINQLNLNHISLCADRKLAIRRALEPLKNKWLSASAARRSAQAYRDTAGKMVLEPYCVAIAQALEAYVMQLESRTKKTR